MLFAGLFSFLISIHTWAATAGDPVCLIASSGELRKGPNAASRVTLVVGQYTPFLRLADKMGWSRVQYFDGEIFWIQSKYVLPFNKNLSCAIVKSRSAKLYSEASSRAPSELMLVLDRYSPLRKLERDDEHEVWIKVQTDLGIKAWIDESNLWIPSRNTQIRIKN